MSKRALVLATATGMVATIAIAGVFIYSIRAGVAPVTIPIFALVLGPAIAAAAMVATCSMVAPPVMRTVELRSSRLEEPVENAM